MIHVDRGAVAKPPVLDLGNPQSPASKELEKIRQHFTADVPAEAGRLTFNVYKHQAVKDALTELFHGKCAYCESVYAKVQPMDVEHFRPKSGYMLDGKLRKPGYWWLAADWDNLLPSCIDCNRKRKQQGLAGETEAMGKESYFPIDDESRRARAEGAEAEEVRLLLDPCRDRPEELLSFGEQGEVKARAEAGDLERRMVKQSAAVYGLNRSALAASRHQLTLEVGNLISSLSRAATALKQDSSDANRGVLADLLRQFLHKRRDQAPYAGLVRQHTATLEPAMAAFVEHHYGDRLPDGDQPTANTQLLDGDQLPAAEGSVLERFVDVFATPQPALTDTVEEALDAFAF